VEQKLRKADEAELERQARAAFEEAKRKVDEADQLAAIKAEQERQATVAAEAEAKREARPV
jgi:hypothetical protein